MGMVGGYDAHFYCDCCNDFCEVNGIGVETYQDAIHLMKKDEGKESWLLRDDGVVLCEKCKAKNNPKIMTEGEREGCEWTLKKEGVASEGFVLVPKDQIKGYYSHDGDNYQVHETLDQAKNDALAAIDHYSDQLADGNFHPESDGNFQDISFGVVLGKSDYSLVRIVTQQDIDDGESKYPVGTEILDLYLNEAMIEAAEGET